MKLFARQALLPEGWRNDVLIDIGPDALIQKVACNAAPETWERCEGALIPGMANVHSHAFQRAMAGLTEKSGPHGDNFWAWRDLMYRFLARIAPEDNEAIAAQLYVEMLKAGYTSVAEFHYLHHDEAGRAYANPAEMCDRIVAAANRTGIGLTMLPVLYRHATFGGVPPNDGQKRFVMEVDAFNKLTQSLQERKGQGALRQVGIAPHSLRAVTPEELKAIVTAFNAMDTTGPIHIHVAEQHKEVDDCLAWAHKPPVAWLLDNVQLNDRWCLVHATHLDDDETFRVAKSGAVAGLCPTTEANLGDGVFNAPDYLIQHGRFGIGGDSHVGVDPFLELAVIEYAQRLLSARRNILVSDQTASIGGGLFRRAVTGGAQAIGQRAGAIARGCRADFVVLDNEDPALVEREGDDLLDAAIFAPRRNVVRDVMVDGKWVVQEGRHADEAVIFERYRRTLKKLLAA